MKRLYALVVAASLCFPSIGAVAWWQSIQQVAVSGGGGGGCTQATTFLARTSGLNGTHTTAYTNLICGLVSTSATEGGTLYSRFDVLMIYATQDATTSLLNLPNTTYATTNSTGSTFTADTGYTGNILITTFNPATATSPQYTQNSAHISYWSLLNGTDTSEALVNDGTSTNLFPEFSDGNTYIRVNDASSSGGFAAAVDPRGLVLGNRDGATTRQGYHNGVSIGTYGSVPSTAPANAVFDVLGTGGTSIGVAAAISMGASLSATDQLNFYNLMRAYMTAVGVP